MRYTVGGMKTKIEAAIIANMAGIPLLVIHPKDIENLKAGTLFITTKESKKKAVKLGLYPR